MLYRFLQQLLVLSALVFTTLGAAFGQIQTVKRVIDGQYIGPYWVVSTDFDDDGDIDIVATSVRDGIRWYENDGSGIFTQHEVFKNIKESWQIFVDDLDNDDDKDILSMSNDVDNEQILWYENRGDGSFTEHTVEGEYVQTHAVFAADLDGNDHMDLMAATYTNKTLDWWQNDGNENYQKTGIARDFSSPHCINAADLDGDGDLDVVAAGGGKTAWFRNDGSGNFSENILALIGGFTTIPVDLDGDGDLDIIRNQRDNGDVDWFENLGNGVFIERLVASGLGESWGQAIGDLDLDGDMDIVVCEYVNNKISYWLNDGNQNFTGFTLDDVVTRPRGVNLADYNNDGKLDIGVALSKDQAVVWYENTTQIIRNITVTAPNGGESFDGGDQTQIKWNSQGNVGNNVKIEYSTNGGSTWTQIAASAPNTGSFNWTVPAINTTNARIRVTSTSDPTITDMSNASFNITVIIVDTLILTAPNGGEDWTGGTLHTITWTSSGALTQVKIEYSTDNGATWNVIVATSPNSGTFSWNVPNTPTTLALVRISDPVDGVPLDQSDSPFTISSSSLTLTSPNGGESLTSGEIKTITWTTTGSIPFVKLEYSTNGGISWITIAGNISNNGSFNWTVPDIVTTNGRVRVSDSSDGSPSDQSDGNFLIIVVNLTLFAPNGGEIWLGGSTQSILWSSSGNISNVKLEYSTDDGTTWQTIIASTPNNGSHSWVIPDVSTITARVRISDASNPSRNDMSTAAFRINGSTLTLSSPGGGESWLAGSTQVLTWTSTGLVTAVKISYSVGKNGSPVLVMDNAPNTGTYNWQLPEIHSDSVRVIIADAADGEPQIISNYFSIERPSLTLTAPNGGEIWTAGSFHTISWDSVGVIGHVNLDYSVDNGSTWTAIVSGVENTGSYEWTVPNWLSFNALVRISSAINGDIDDTSDAVFSILSASLTITSPNGGEEWLKGSQHVITWHSTGLLDFVDLEYSLDNGATWQIIAVQTQNDGSFDWSLPDVQSSTVRVRISNSGSGIPGDMSDAAFTITDVVSSVQRMSGLVPENFEASQNYPNPFNLDTRIDFSVPKTAEVSLRIFNVRGELVQTLHNGTLAPGNYTISWDGHTSQGAVAPSGIYIYQIKAANWQTSRRLLLVK